MTNDKLKRRAKRKRRVQKKIIGKTQKPRISVFRSSRFISAQLIDDALGKTLVFATEKEIENKKEGKHTRTEKAKSVGLLLAKKAEKIKVKQVVFDRSGYKYHGRVKALAEGAREGGLQF